MRTHAQRAAHRRLTTARLSVYTRSTASSRRAHTTDHQGALGGEITSTLPCVDGLARSLGPVCYDSRAILSPRPNHVPGVADYARPLNSVNGSLNMSEEPSLKRPKNGRGGPFSRHSRFHHIPTTLRRRKSRQGRGGPGSFAPWIIRPGLRPFRETPIENTTACVYENAPQGNKQTNL